MAKVDTSHYGALSIDDCLPDAVVAQRWLSTITTHTGNENATRPGRQTGLGTG
jgi:hypothetical protein